MCVWERKWRGTSWWLPADLFCVWVDFVGFIFVGFIDYWDSSLRKDHHSKPSGVCVLHWSCLCAWTIDCIRELDRVSVTSLIECGLLQVNSETGMFESIHVSKQGLVWVGISMATILATRKLSNIWRGGGQKVSDWPVYLRDDARRGFHYQIGVNCPTWSEGQLFLPSPYILIMDTSSYIILYINGHRIGRYLLHNGHLVYTQWTACLALFCLCNSHKWKKDSTLTVSILMFKLFSHKKWTTWNAAQLVVMVTATKPAPTSLWRTEIFFRLSCCCDKLWNNICPPLFQVLFQRNNMEHSGYVTKTTSLSITPCSQSGSSIYPDHGLKLV